MAVVTFTPRAFGARGQGKAGKDGSAPAVTYRATYRAHCDSPSDTPPVIYKYLLENKGTYPWYGATMTLGNGSDVDATVTNIEVDTVEGSDRDFDVSYTYEPSTNGDAAEAVQPGLDGRLTNDPLSWLDDIEVSFTQNLTVVELAVFHGFSDRNGAIQHPVAWPGMIFAPSNSAIVPYDPPIEKEVDIKVIRISKWKLEYNGEVFDKYQGAVNSDNVTIFKPEYGYRDVIKPYHGKIKSIGGSFQLVNGLKLWRQTIEIHVNPMGWRRKLLDLGNVHITPAAGQEISVVDFDGNPTQNKDDDDYPQTSPLPLNGKGGLKADGFPNVYGEWGVDEEVPFMPLANQAW